MSNEVIIAYIWLAIGGAIVLAGLSSGFKVVARQGWAIVIAGFSLLAWSLYNIQSTLTLASLGSDIPALRKEVVFQNRELIRLRNIENFNWDRFLVERTRHNETQNKLAAARQQLAGDWSDYEKRLTDSATEISSERMQHGETKNLLAVVQKKLAGAIAELSTNKTQPSEPASALAVLRKDLAGVAAELSSEKTQRGKLQVLLTGAQKDLADAATQVSSERARHDETKNQLTVAQKKLTEATTTLSSERAGHIETKKRLAASQKGLAGAGVELSTERTRYSETKNQLSIAQTKLTEATTKLSSERTGRIDTKKRLAATQKGLAGAAVELSTERTLHGETKTQLAAVQKKLDDTAAQLASARSVKLTQPSTVETPPGATPAENETPVVAKKIKSIDVLASLSNVQLAQFFSIQPLDETELVTGQKGKYYQIQLASPTGGSVPSFNLGKYSIEPNSEQILRKALTALNENIISKIGIPKTATVYVRGRANNVRFIQPTVLKKFDDPYKNIEYLPVIANGGKYESVSQRQILTKDYGNRELPNLRAAFTKKIIKELLPTVEVTILQGEISDVVDHGALAVDIFLRLTAE